MFSSPIVCFLDTKFGNPIIQQLFYSSDSAKNNSSFHFSYYISPSIKRDNIHGKIEEKKGFN